MQFQPDGYPAKVQKSQILKKLNLNKFRQDILDHPLYIQNLYEKDLDIIADNIITMIQQCLDSQAPIKIIQISNKSKEKLSEQARLKLVERDNAHAKYKETKNLEDLRLFKNLRNSANHYISKERFNRKVTNFNREDMTTKEKWALAKRETGQTNFITPKIIMEKDKIHSKKLDIAKLHESPVFAANKSDFEQNPQNPG